MTQETDRAYKKGMKLVSNHWKDAGDNLPSIVEVTQVRSERIYYRTVRMYDGHRHDLGSKWYATAEYLDAHYKPISLEEFTARLQYRQLNLSPDELMANLSRKTWLPEHKHVMTYEQCYTTHEQEGGS